MRANLKAEMVRKGITIKDIVKLLNISEKTARNKINNVTQFTVDEALKLRAVFFPTLPFDYLFESDNDQSTTKNIG